MADQPLPDGCNACKTGGHSRCQIAGCGCGCVASARWMHYHVRRPGSTPRQPS